MLGEKEVMYDPKEAFACAQDSSPNITVEMVKGVGHLMTMENAEYINNRILEFL